MNIATYEDYCNAYSQFVNSHRQYVLQLGTNNQYMNYLNNVYSQYKQHVAEINFNLFWMMCTLYNMWYLKRFENDPDFQLFNEVFKMNVSENDFNRYYDAFKQLK